MRRTPRTLANAREKLVQLEQEFTRLLTRIEAMRDSVADSLVRLDGHCRDGQFRSDPRKRRNYKRDSALPRPDECGYLSILESGCITELFRCRATR